MSNCTKFMLSLVALQDNSNLVIKTTNLFFSGFYKLGIQIDSLGWAGSFLGRVQQVARLGQKVPESFTLVSGASLLLFWPLSFSMQLGLLPSWSQVVEYRSPLASETKCFLRMVEAVRLIRFCFGAYSVFTAFDSSKESRGQLTFKGRTKLHLSMRRVQSEIIGCFYLFH